MAKMKSSEIKEETIRLFWLLDNPNLSEEERSRIINDIAFINKDLAGFAVQKRFKSYLNLTCEKLRITPDDLFSIAYSAVGEAISAFDVSRGIAFSTFAIRIVNNRISKMFRETDGKTETDISLFTPVSSGDGDKRLLGDSLTSGDDYSSLENSVEFKEIMNTLDDVLDQKEKDILFMYYFSEMTQMEISKEVGLSQVQVSRIKERALQKSRRKLESLNVKLDKSII